jgi:hypothetical protein
MLAEGENHMKSHEYAQQLMETANRILARPEVEFGGSSPYLFLYFFDKEGFVEVVRAMGNGKKEFSGGDYTFIPEGTCLRITAPRDTVCRMVQEAKYVCEPLLSAEEAAKFSTIEDATRSASSAL